jgi:hypothetical protein
LVDIKDFPIPSQAPTSTSAPSSPSPSPSPGSYTRSAYSLPALSPSLLPSPFQIPSPHITFTLTPTQPNSGRELLDQGVTWGLGSLSRFGRCTGRRGQRGEEIGKKEKETSVWFAGDTGYQTSEGLCPVFKCKSAHPAARWLLTRIPSPRNRLNTRSIRSWL